MGEWAFTTVGCLVQPRRVRGDISGGHRGVADPDTSDPDILS